MKNKQKHVIRDYYSRLYELVWRNDVDGFEAFVMNVEVPKSGADKILRSLLRTLRSNNTDYRKKRIVALLLEHTTADLGHSYGFLLSLLIPYANSKLTTALLKKTSDNDVAKYRLKKHCLQHLNLEVLEELEKRGFVFEKDWTKAFQSAICNCMKSDDVVRYLYQKTKSHDITESLFYEFVNTEFRDFLDFVEEDAAVSSRQVIQRMFDFGDISKKKMKSLLLKTSAETSNAALSKRLEELQESEDIEDHALAFLYWSLTITDDLSLIKQAIFDTKLYPLAFNNLIKAEDELKELVSPSSFSAKQLVPRRL